MSDPFIAEIRIFAGNFAPRGWAFCHGQLLPIAQNTALFALIGTTFGGDGRTTTALPDLQGRAPMHPGNGPGLTNRRLGQKVGAGTVTLTAAQMATHNHTLSGANSRASSSTPDNAAALARGVGGFPYKTGSPNVDLDSGSILPTGGAGAHDNRQPYLALNYIIALVGMFPSRN